MRIQDRSPCRGQEFGRAVSRGSKRRTVVLQRRGVPGGDDLMPQAIAVFDFDYTLTTCDTAARFFGWLLRRAPWKMLLGAPVVLALGPLALFSRTRRVPIRFLVWLATFGAS